MASASPADPPGSAETLDADLLRVIEALARAHVDEDYAAAQAEEAHAS